MKLTEQSQLKINTTCRPVNRRYRKVSQASWWFGQMRRAVEHACPSGQAAVAAAAQPHQRSLPLAVTAVWTG